MELAYGGSYMNISLSEKLTKNYAYLLLIIYGIVIEVYTLYIELIVEMDSIVMFYHSTLGGAGIYVIIAGLLLPFFKNRPGGRIDACGAQIAIFLMLTPFFVALWLLFLIYPPHY